MQHIADSAVNAPLWRTEVARGMAKEFAADRLADHNVTGRTGVWLNGWFSAWTQAYIVFCSVLESRCFDRTMLLRWADCSEASQWAEGTPIVRRWKSRETGKWSYAVSSIREVDWGVDGCEFLRLNADE